MRLENHSTRDLFIQAGEVLRGGNQDRAVAGDLIIPAPRHEPESCMVPVFCAEPECSVPMRDWTPDQFTLFDQLCPSRRLKRELRHGYQEDVWREITSLRDVVFDLVSHGGTRPTPPYSLWTLIEQLEAQGWLTPYLQPMLPLAESHREATGAVFVLAGKFNSAELYATPALFRQLWPQTLYAMVVEALVEEKLSGASWQGALPTKGEVTAWLAATHRRGAVGHTDKINKRVHRRLRSVGTQTRFECLDQEQDGLCVHGPSCPASMLIRRDNVRFLARLRPQGRRLPLPASIEADAAVHRLLALCGRTSARVLAACCRPGARRNHCTQTASAWMGALQLIDVQNLFCEIDKDTPVASPQFTG